LSDTFDSIKRSTDVSNEVHRKVKELKEAKTMLESAKQSYESSKKQLETLTSNLADQKTLVEQNAKEKNTLLAQTKNKETEYQKMLSDRQKKKGELEAELSDVESKLQTTVDAGKLPKYGKGVLQYPVANVKITQYFGNTPFASKNPQVYNGGGHNGIDFGVPTGTTIMSAQSGVVLGTGNTDTACNGVSYGKWVLVKHNNGLTTLYAHLSVISVSGGQSVSAGQKLGLSGNTGYSTGPHLHFTVYASDAVEITNYRSKVCGTNMTMPIAPKPGYLNPLSYL
jgi:murein DD-endopeptidase MepM/ murein hydrolase activator NlpD